MSLLELFLALDVATKENAAARVTSVANAIARVFGSKLGPELVLNPEVGPHLSAGT